MTETCCHCGTKNEGRFPEEANGTQNYGAGIIAFAVLLSNYAMVSIDKIAKIFRDVFGVSISCGTIVNFNVRFADKIKPLLEEIKAKLVASPVAHFDETGLRVNGKLMWLHNASTHLLTYIAASRKRGREGVDENGVMIKFRGVAIHDCWAAYFKYTKCLHALCGAHLLRELQWVIDNTAQPWACEMQALLLKMKRVKERYILMEKTEISYYYSNLFEEEYAHIIALGDSENPIVAPDCGRKKMKRTKTRCLLDRFIKYQTEITRFVSDFEVTFDNNQAERDFRFVKGKQKVSGGLRSEDGAQNFAAIASIISTASKQNRSVFSTLCEIVTGRCVSVVGD